MANVLGELFGGIADAIREKTGGSDTMKPAQFPEQIRAIETGSAADVRYVTFLSDDGATVYGVKPVAVGDDCADPIARGLFDTPTKERTDRYIYTYRGWATEPGGAVDADALSSVTEDRSLYANFTASVRYYTVRFYDGDTLLTTYSCPYGSTPSYVPAKAGYTFTGWTPELTAVTEDASYYAGWIEKMDFSALTWAQISAYCKSSNVEELFEIGAAKDFTYTLSGGTTVAATAQIVGFYHDDLADGSGKAPITLRLNNFLSEGRFWNAVGSYERNSVTWGTSDVRRGIQSYMGDNGYGFPSELTAIVQTVSKKYYDIPNGQYAAAEDTVFLPSMSELGFEIDGRDEGTCYEAFTAGKVIGTKYSDLVYTDSSGTARAYWTRTKKDNEGYAYTVNALGMGSNNIQGATETHWAVGFICIG